VQAHRARLDPRPERQDDAPQDRALPRPGSAGDEGGRPDRDQPRPTVLDPPERHRTRHRGHVRRAGVGDGRRERVAEQVPDGQGQPCPGVPVRVDQHPRDIRGDREPRGGAFNIGHGQPRHQPDPQHHHRPRHGHPDQSGNDGDRTPVPSLRPSVDRQADLVGEGLPPGPVPALGVPPLDHRPPRPRMEARPHQQCGIEGGGAGDDGGHVCQPPGQHGDRHGEVKPQQQPQRPTHRPHHRSDRVPRPGETVRHGPGLGGHQWAPRSWRANPARTSTSSSAAESSRDTA